MKIFNAVFAVTLLAMLLAFLASKLLHSYWYSEDLQLDSEPVFLVAPGTGVNSVVAKLADQGVFRRPLLVKLALRYFEPGLVIKAGEYQLPESASRAQLFELLASGISLQYPVTLVEGYSVAEAFEAIAAQRESAGIGETVGADPLQLNMLHGLLSSEANSLMQAVPATPVPPERAVEGWFFPDTYYITKGDSARDIFTRAHRKMLEVLLEEWAQREQGLPYSSPYQALIMASLIEKETGVVDEREEIAGVFVRRLRKGMRLQTDPTVIYGLGVEYQGNLRRKHLKADTPYNTYTRHGLPPTPIALPGRGAIRAALNPAAGDALYFVAKGDGRHHFSATFAEHQRAVKQYQIQNRRSDYRSSPKAGAG